MKLLLNGNQILFHAKDIIFGEFEGVEKWAIFNDDGKVSVYALDDGFEVVDYEKELPKDIDISSKYVYDNGEVINNPDWRPSEEETLKEQVENLEATLDDLLTNIIPMLLG